MGLVLAACSSSTTPSDGGGATGGRGGQATAGTTGGTGGATKSSSTSPGTGGAGAGGVGTGGAGAGGAGTGGAGAGGAGTGGASGPQWTATHPTPGNWGNQACSIWFSVTTLSSTSSTISGLTYRCGSAVGANQGGPITNGVFQSGNTSVTFTDGNTATVNAGGCSFTATAGADQCRPSASGGAGGTSQADASANGGAGGRDAGPDLVADAVRTDGALDVNTAGLDAGLDSSELDGGAKDVAADTSADLGGTSPGLDGGAASAVDGGSADGGAGCGLCGALEECWNGQFCVAKSVSVANGAFTIDATEVSAGQYASWLASSPPLDGQPSYCSWNTTYTPSCSWPTVAGLEKRPVVCVDWCDAYAYCARIGKRLCGGIGGGESAFAAYSSATTSQWFNACTSGGVNTYPYGKSFGAGKCNDYSVGGVDGPAVDVGSMTACQSSVAGYQGVFDLNGNVSEWEDSCDAQTGASDNCRVRGGIWMDTLLSGMSCALDKTVARSGASYGVNRSTGFRCCSR